MFKTVRRLFSRTPKPRRWAVSFADSPWLDRPDAAAELDRRTRAGRYSSEQAEMLRHWAENGYVILPGAVDAGLIDALQADLDGIWTTDVSIAGLTVSGANVAPDDPIEMPHARLTALPAEERMRIRDRSRWRTHSFYKHSLAARTIFKNDRLRETASLILDHPALASYSINFLYGSQQELHQDGMVFAVVPPNYLIGAWIACEDIVPESGPLVYYPGSHRLPVYPPFAENYPQTMLKTCSAETMMAYHAHLDAVATRYERRTFLARKGDVLLWHAMIVHGGEKQRAEKVTRKSFILHYLGQGYDVLDQIHGPFNW
jgi:hypothetical protein